MMFGPKVGVWEDNEADLFIILKRVILYSPTLGVTLGQLMDFSFSYPVFQITPGPLS